MKFILLLVLLSIRNVALAAPEPVAKVRAAVDHEGEIWVGQRIPLVVELLAPGYFSGSPIFDLPQVPGLLILPPAESPTVSSEQNDSVTYSVQRHELMVFSRRSGTITIPPFEIRLGIKRQPLDHDSVEQTLRTAALSFTAKFPPGSQPNENLITSTDLTVTETWKPEPGSHAKVGDAFIRTIVWTASDVPGMAFPPFDAGPVAGLGIYAGDSAVNDTSSRGVLHGERKDAVTYVCKTGGRFVIPAHTVRWWDPADMEMREVVFPTRSFDVAAPPVLAQKPVVRTIRLFSDHWQVILGATVGMGFLVVIVHLAKGVIFGFLKRLLPRYLTPLNPS